MMRKGLTLAYGVIPAACLLAASGSMAETTHSLPAAAEQTAGGATARDGVMRVFDDYVRGWKDGDLQLLSRIYANDARVSAYWPDPSRAGLLLGWPQISTDLRGVFGQIRGMDLEFNDRRIDIYGETAVLTASWIWHEPAAPPFATGRTTFVFDRRGGEWLLVHEHSSVTPFLCGEAK